MHYNRLETQQFKKRNENQTINVSCVHEPITH